MGYSAKALVGFMAAWLDGHRMRYSRMILSLMLIIPSIVGELRLNHTLMMYIRLSASTCSYSKRARFPYSMHCKRMHVIDLRIALVVRVGVNAKCSRKYM